MNENDNKRRGPDVWVKIRRISGVVVWFVMLVALYLLDSAKPENVTFFDRLNNIKRRTTWNTDYNQMIFYVMILGLIISVSGLYINSKRNRRKSDKYPLSLLIMMTISIIGILMHLFFF